MFQKLTLTLFAVFLTLGLNAQNDSLTQINDSINNAKLLKYNAKLAEIEKGRVQDSLKRIELEKQLSSLKTTDNLKKEELEKELKDLKASENNRVDQKKAQIAAMKENAVGFPVYGFYKDTLFLIYSKLGSFSPRDRAEAITNRIANLGDVFRSKDSLYVVLSDETFDIMHGETIILSLNENDGIWNESTPKEMAESYALLITKRVRKYQYNNSGAVIAKRIGLLSLLLVLLIIAMIALKRLFKWTAKKIESQDGKLLRGIKIKEYSLLDSKREVRFILTINKIVKWGLLTVVLYIAIPIAFNIFPGTENYADKLFGYITNPMRKIGSGFLAYLPNLITIAIIIMVFRYAVKGLKFFKTEIQTGRLKLNGFYPDWANPTFQIIRVLFFAFMIIVIFPYLPGSDSPVFRGVSVFLGVLLTFGSSGSLSNIVAGIVLTYMRLFKIGDRVKIGEVVGDVIEKSLLVTRIRTTKNEIVSIPNSTVMSGHTINYSGDAPEKGLIIHSTVTIGYDVPWAKMHKALIDAAKRTELTLPEPEPFVLQTSLDDFYVSYQINAYIHEANKQAKIYSDLHQHIQDVCNENGIEILSPHYRAARDGNQTTIPVDYLDPNYTAPSFKVKVDSDKG